MVFLTNLLSLFLAIYPTSTCSQTVSNLNTTLYLGRWYQMYSDLIVEATFENSSYCDTADYGVYTNGTISVLNRERQFNTTGPEREIFGWANTADTTKPGQLTVYLQTVGLGAPYWIYELGPPTYSAAGLYEYSIVSDPFRATLFVLARNVTEFFQKWNKNVTMSLTRLGFTGVFNYPLPTVQAGCEYW